MSRPLRIEFNNAWYHVMNRGAGRKTIFKYNYHRKMFLDLLEEATKMFQAEIHAYCLMDNHYHLLIKTPLGNLSRIMRHINSLFTMRFNTSIKTDGALFRGRYKAILVDDDNYQLMVSRYIHLNPVEANIVPKAEDFYWSSYSAYIGKSKKPNWLHTQIILSQVDYRKEREKIQSYQAFVEDGNASEIIEFYSKKFTSPLLGSAEFIKQHFSKIKQQAENERSPDINRARKILSIFEIIDGVSLYFKINDDEIYFSQKATLNWPRQIVFHISRKEYGYSLSAISKAFNIKGYWSVSSTIQRCKLHMQANPSLRKQYLEILAKLMHKN